MPRTVSFHSQGIKVAGNLYLPENTQPKKHAAIVIGHPGGGVKEQTAGLYAEKLRNLGFITLAFDAAYQGESEGLPRYLEDPNQRVEDFKSAVSYLTTLDEVDPERIGVLGICAAGGYATCAAQTDVRIKAVAGISSADTGELWREGMNGSLSFEELQQGLQEAARQRTREAKGEEPYLSNWVPKTASDAATLPPRSLYKEAYDYYRTPRAQHPRSTNEYVFRSMDKLVQFSAFNFVHLISPRPILLIAGTDADTKYLSENAIQKAKEPKELFLVPGASHVDLYDVLKYVDPVVQKLGQYYTQYLVDN
ncbi:hypothetical protein K7432_012690 [Basidiobolus ranarum]|uniref:Dienelactone hydrolase domain-containing protein n=1 Tax=Basidiobolus ranarum TaxID=34480 RepID=A0ABR2VRV8_9FUNG